MSNLTLRLMLKNAGKSPTGTPDSRAGFLALNLFWNGRGNPDPTKLPVPSGPGPDGTFKSSVGLETNRTRQVCQTRMSDLPIIILRRLLDRRSPDGLRSLKSLAMMARHIQKQNFVLTTFTYLVIFFTILAGLK